MSAEIVQFIPKSDPASDRALLMEQYRKALFDANRMNDKGEIPDTAPAEYAAPDNDCA